MMAWILCIAAFLVDRATKWWAAASLQNLSEAVTLIPGVVALRYATNTGIAFSLLEGKGWLVALIALLLVAGGVVLLRPYRLGPFFRASLGLMAGGALGNLADRLLQGYVVDMVELLFVSFPIFNLADVALTIGAVGAAVCLLFRPGEFVKKEDAHGG